MIDLRAEIGTRIKTARQDAGVTQQELAAMIGLSRASIEAGRQGLFLEDAAAIARILAVSIDSLGEKAPVNPSPGILLPGDR